jgi:hypothetical protein
MHKTLLSLTALASAVLIAPAFAGTIPYSPIGTVAPAPPTLTAIGSTIDVYFYGVSAADTDYIEIEDVTDHTNSGQIFDNQTTSPGAEYTFSTNPGDVIEFLLFNHSTGNTFSSDPADNSDGYNHTYMTAFSGSTSPDIPAGEYIGFEDEYIGTTNGSMCGGSKNQSDCDYNDEQIVVTGVAAAPEPNSLALLGTSVLGVAGIVRRRFGSR